MILEHYQSEPFVGPVRNTAQCARDTLRGKPSGLWVSVKGRSDWPDWCEGERWGLAALRCRHLVTLTQGANIKVVRGAKALDAFGRKYGYLDTRYGDGLGEWNRKIYWERVVAQFDGIIIAPYLWSRRLDVGWYYGWDCASGCIWNAGAIAAVELIEERERVREAA